MKFLMIKDEILEDYYSPVILITNKDLVRTIRS